jgi:hypothetical protein
MRRQAAGTLLGIGLLTLGLSGCGGGDTPGTAVPAGGGDGTSATAKKDNPQAAGDPAKDVKIIMCEPGSRAGVSAKVEVRNSLGRAWEYVGDVKFLDAAGKEIADGVFNTGTLEANATIVEDVPGANVYTKVPSVTCKLENVHLDEPGPD